MNMRAKKQSERTRFDQLSCGLEIHKVVSPTLSMKSPPGYLLAQASPAMTVAQPSQRNECNSDLPARMTKYVQAAPKCIMRASGAIHLL